MKKALFFILALCMVFSLCACGKTSEQPGPEAADNGIVVKDAGEPEESAAEENPAGDPGQAAADAVLADRKSDETLRLILPAEPTALTLQGAAGGAQVLMWTLMYDTLFRYDYATNSVVPSIAKSMDWIDDTHVRFTLRDDVVAYNGDTIKASDVLYTISCGVNGPKAAAFVFFDLENSYAEDDYNVVLALKEPRASVDALVCANHFGIISESATEAVGGFEAATQNAYVNTGMYNLVEWVAGDHILLERNENFWDDTRIAYFKNVEITWVSDANTRAMSIISGDADLTIELSTSQAESIANSPDAVVEIYNKPVAQSAWINCSRAPFDDVRVREAMYLLIDSDAICNNAMGGYVEACDTAIASSSPYYTKPNFTREVNVERAKELLAEAGYEDGFEFTLSCRANFDAVAQVIQDGLKQGGITANIDIVEASTETTLGVSGDFDMLITQTQCYDIYVVADRFDGRMTTAEANGGAQYNNDECNAIIDECRSALDVEARTEAFAKLGQYAVDNYLCIGLYNDITVCAHASQLGGGGLTMDGYFDVSSVYLN